MSSSGRVPQRGVTLLEILVAVVIMAIGAVTVFQIFPMAFAASNKSKAKTLAYELGAGKLEEARSEFLFGGIQTDTDYYWGNANAPNPDQTAYTTVNTAGSWRAFSQDGAYWYRVDTAPVIDPLRKYAEFYYDRTSGTGGFGSLYRITVTVRGPLDNWGDWDEVPVARRSAIEVVLATYVSNKMLGDAVLARDAYNNTVFPTSSNASASDDVPIAGVTADGGADLDRATTPNGSLTILYVSSASGGYPSPENFTVFQFPRLTDTERSDTGPTYYRPDLLGAVSTDSSFYRGLDSLGLDNLTIFRSAQTSLGVTIASRYVAETNKVIGMLEPGAAPGYPHDVGFWGLILQNPLKGYDTDSTERTAFAAAGTTTQVMDDDTDQATAGAPVDAAYTNITDPDWVRTSYGRPQYKGVSLINRGDVVGSDGVDDFFLGYPATTTRVRFRITLRTPS